MKRHQRTKDDLSYHRAEVDADDGLDPRDFFKKESRPASASRKAQQLCSQVSETLYQLFAESTDPVVQSLQVVSVTPAPDASQLLVIVTPSIGAQVSADEASAGLARAGGWLRGEIATSITRKRVPQLAFRFLPATTGEVQR
jgi:ribosome-binding factor A